MYALSSRRIVQRAEKRRSKYAKLRRVHRPHKKFFSALELHASRIRDRFLIYHAAIMRIAASSILCIVRSTGRLQREISVPIDGRELAG